LECFILALFSGGFIPKYSPIANLIPIQGWHDYCVSYCVSESILLLPLQNPQPPT
jgi:hypothetical protein